MITIIEQGQM